MKLGSGADWNEKKGEKATRLQRPGGLSHIPTFGRSLLLRLPQEGD